MKTWFLDDEFVFGVELLAFNLEEWGTDEEEDIRVVGWFGGSGAGWGCLGSGERWGCYDQWWSKHDFDAGSVGAFCACGGVAEAGQDL
jgi:hypothetical protein